MWGKGGWIVDKVVQIVMDRVVDRVLDKVDRTDMMDRVYRTNTFVQCEKKEDNSQNQ